MLALLNHRSSALAYTLILLSTVVAYGLRYLPELPNLFLLIVATRLCIALAFAIGIIFVLRITGLVKQKGVLLNAAAMIAAAVGVSMCLYSWNTSLSDGLLNLYLAA